MAAARHVKLLQLYDQSKRLHQPTHYTLPSVLGPPAPRTLASEHAQHQGLFDDTGMFMARGLPMVAIAEITLTLDWRVMQCESARG